jgi:hypothetical protein
MAFTTLREIPYPGELFVPGHPGTLQLARVRVGGDTSDSTLDGLINDTSWADSDGAFHLFSIPAGTFVEKIAVEVEEDFSDAIEVVFGDCSASNGYFTDTLLDPLTTTAYPIPSSSVASTYRYGKLYTAADSIQMSLSGAWTAGQLGVYIWYALNVASDAP